MESLTNINSLPDELLFAILRRCFKQPESCDIGSLWSPFLYRCLDDDDESRSHAGLVFKTPIPIPPPVADAAQNLHIASVCGRWRRVVKRNVTTLLVKEDAVVSLDHLSVAVARFPNLTHLHLSDNSVETLNDAFLEHLAESCPKLTTLHVGRSFAAHDQEDDGYEPYCRKENHPISTEGLNRFFIQLPLLEELSLFCPHEATKLPSSFFQMRHLRTLVLDNASALENPEFANLTALTTICITFPWNLLDLATLLRLPRLAHLTTFAPYESHQPSAGTASIVLPSYIKSLTFAVASPPFDTIILPSASAFVALEELLITNGSGLTDLPNHIDYLLPSLRKLTFRKCSSLVHLPENFASLSRLETLIFYDCGLLTLPDSFGDLPALKLLVLEFVPLWGLPPSFCDLTSLEALFLAGCDELRQLPAGFSRLTALKALCITECVFPLPDDVGALVSLKSLRFLCYRQSFPASFTKLLSLTSLQMDRYIPLPEAVGELSSLRELKIHNSSVCTLPMSLFQLTRLQTLVITSFHALVELPSRLDMLVGLTTLELTYCEQLSSLPAGLPPSLETLCLGPFREGSSHEVDIGHLTQLRVLKLTRVGVCCGPAVSGRVLCLQELEQLEMRVKGDIRELPVTLALVRLPRLRSLLIQAPGICSLPENMAAALPDLQQLELLSWSPEELPECIWELSSLMSLKINAPQLLALLQGMSCLSRLRKLELIRCKALQHLPDFLTQLHRLSLRSTLLSSVPEEFVLLD